MAYFWLTPPSRAIFILSVFLALLALLVRYADVTIPVVSAYTFETLLTAFLLLLAGNLFRACSQKPAGQRGPPRLASFAIKKTATGGRPRPPVSRRRLTGGGD